MADLNIDAVLRWARFDRRKPLARRPDDDLPFIGAVPPNAQGLLLDTCVYIDQIRGCLPGRVEALIDARQPYHSTVAIQELMHGVGALDPRDHRTANAVARIVGLIRTMRPHRTYAPDPDTQARAALLGGILCRTQRFSDDNRMRALMDATLFLQAGKLGLAVVTRNVGDFDLMLQLLPRTAVLMYRL